jgi:hypothetical protein
MHINWKRLLWVFFIALYTTLFFYNFFKPFENWLFVYVYTMILVLWLCSEYYRKHSFFQSGLLLDYHWAIRAAFALFFYSSFIIGLATTIWWPGNKIGIYPFINLIGILILIVSIFLRWKFYLRTSYHKQNVQQFYFTIYLLLASIALGYGSIFLLCYVLVIGFPLVVLETVHEKKNFHNYESMIMKAKNYPDLQQKYLVYVQELQNQDKKRGAR